MYISIYLFIPLLIIFLIISLIPLLCLKMAGMKLSDLEKPARERGGAGMKYYGYNQFFNTYIEIPKYMAAYAFGRNSIYLSPWDLDVSGVYRLKLPYGHLSLIRITNDNEPAPTDPPEEKEGDRGEEVRA